MLTTKQKLTLAWRVIKRLYRLFIGEKKMNLSSIKMKVLTSESWEVLIAQFDAWAAESDVVLQSTQIVRNNHNIDLVLFYMDIEDDEDEPQTFSGS